MQNQIRLCYLSERIESNSDLLNELNEILVTSRNFNKEHNICGVLYYADGSFFQCLEGDKEIVHHLFYEKIKKDRRHNNIFHFPDQVIYENKFQNWSMKYVNQNSDIFSFFTARGFNKFEAKALTEKNIGHFLEILFNQKDDSIKVKKGFKNTGTKLYL